MAGRISHLLDGVLHGERHVGAGVAIGDRKDIDGVDPLSVTYQPGGRRRGRALEVLPAPGLPRPGGHVGVRLVGLLGSGHPDSLTLISCTLTLTRTMDTPRADSTVNLTLLMMLRATSEMRVPYSSTTYSSMTTRPSVKVTSTPLWASSRRRSSAQPGLAWRWARPTTP